MPCMSYEPQYLIDDGKQLRDKLARIACRALTELEAVDPTNKVFKNRELTEWWTQHKIDDARAAEERRAAAKKKAARKAALAKLSPEERKVLGL